MSGYLIQTHTTDTYKIENSKIVFTVTSPVVFSGNMEGIKYPKHITTNKEYRQLMEKLSDGTLFFFQMNHFFMLLISY